jgi:hypothetical protein
MASLERVGKLGPLPVARRAGISRSAAIACAKGIDKRSLILHSGERDAGGSQA